MKKLRLKTVAILFFASLIYTSSCDKSNLDLLPHGPTELVYFSTEAEFTKAVFGVYAKLSDFYGWVTVDYNAGPGATLMPLFLLPGDDITTNNSDEEFEQFGSLQASSGRVSNFYTTAYQLIGRANVVLEKTAAVEEGVYTTPGLKDMHTGEALFLRGLAYYYLWNYFGTAPLNTARVTSTDQFTPPSTTGTQLLDQAIDDFTQAAALLPSSWDEANKGRATKNAAFGFLGKCLVFRASAAGNSEDYTAAIAAFNSISGVELVPQFDDNFSFDTENNTESLFEYQASEAPGNNIWLPNDFDNAIGNLSIAWNFYDDQELYGTSRFYATTKLLNSFNSADPRRDLTLDPSDRTIRKYVSRDKASLGWQHASVNNYRLLRLADVLLLKAEAILQSGGSASEAIDLINEVRTRARNMEQGGTEPANYSAAETNKETIMSWIINERLIELAGEGQRWLDLRRWQMQGIINLDNAFFSSNTTTMSFQLPKHLLFPIPNSEIDVNPNVQQNQGY